MAPSSPVPPSQPPFISAVSESIRYNVRLSFTWPFSISLSRWSRAEHTSDHVTASRGILHLPKSLVTRRTHHLGPCHRAGVQRTEHDRRVIRIHTNVSRCQPILCPKQAAGAECAQASEGVGREGSPPRRVPLLLPSVFPENRAVHEPDLFRYRRMFSFLGIVGFGFESNASLAF